MGRLNRNTARMLLAAMLLALASCNTIAGAGRDVQSVGDAVEDAAQ